MLGRIYGRVLLARRAFVTCQDRRSGFRLALDFLIAPLLHLTGPLSTVHSVRIEGLVVSYGLNRGDLNTLREIFIDRVYRLPLTGPFDTLVDLGANIGLTSLWCHRAYGVRRVVAVEPDARNLALLRRNLAQNGLPATLIEAAVAAEDGEAVFRRSDAANLGKLESGHADGGGVAVRTVSMATVLQAVAQAGGRPDLLKVDVEGAEFALFREVPEWLAPVRALLIEIHAEPEDQTPLIARIESAGLRHLPADSFGWPHVTAFVRPGLLAGAPERAYD